MIWNEHHHAWIVSDYYRLLLEQFGAAGKRAFVQAAQTYGEQRGKRMAMRAIADGRPLGLLEYFAIGEVLQHGCIFRSGHVGRDRRGP